MSDDIQIGVLVERIERHPKAKTFRERNLFLDGFARMDFLADTVRRITSYNVCYTKLLRAYLNIVAHWLRTFGCEDAEIAGAERDALNWALQRGSRSGRVAWQFAKDWAGARNKVRTRRGK